VTSGLKLDAKPRDRLPQNSSAIASGQKTRFDSARPRQPGKPSNPNLLPPETAKAAKHRREDSPHPPLSPSQSNSPPIFSRSLQRCFIRLCDPPYVSIPCSPSFRERRKWFSALEGKKKTPPRRNGRFFFVGDTILGRRAELQHERTTHDQLTTTKGARDRIELTSGIFRGRFTARELKQLMAERCMG